MPCIGYLLKLMHDVETLTTTVYSFCVHELEICLCDIFSVEYIKVLSNDNVLYIII